MLCGVYYVWEAIRQQLGFIQLELNASKGEIYLPQMNLNLSVKSHY